MPDVDIFLCCAPKDNMKLKYCIGAILENLKFDGKIYVSSPKPIEEKIDGVKYFRDKDVLNVNPFRFNYRPSWIYQQFLKLFQNVTKSNYYITVDVDVIINRPLDLFEKNGKPIWYSGWEQNHPPYFEYQKKMIGIGKVRSRTFMSDMNFIDKRMVKKMISPLSINSFIDKSVSVINESCYPCEQEMYASYMFKTNPNYYSYRDIKVAVQGKYQPDPMMQNWSDEEISEHIHDMKSKDIDVFALHSWCNNNDKDIWK